MAPDAVPIATTAIAPSPDLQARLAALFDSQQENGPTVMLDPWVVSDLLAAARTTAPPPPADDELPTDAIHSDASDTGHWTSPHAGTDPDLVAAPHLPPVGEDALADLILALSGSTHPQVQGPTTNPEWGAPVHEDAGFGSTWGPPTPQTAALLQGVLDLPADNAVQYARRGDDELVAPGPLVSSQTDPHAVVNPTAHYGPAAGQTAQPPAVYAEEPPSAEARLPKSVGDVRRPAVVAGVTRARAKATNPGPGVASPRSGPTEPALPAQTVPEFDPAVPVATAAAVRPPTAPVTESTVAYKRDAKPAPPAAAVEDDAVGRPVTAPGFGETTVTLKPGTLQPVLDQWPKGVPRAIANRYEQLQRIGQGGHGVVFRAVDKMLDRYVVLKFLLQSTLFTEMARKYFMREVKLSASLNHPNIVHIYDIGNTDGVLWYAMEYVDGVTLAQYLPPGQPMDDLGFLYSAFSQLCEALDHAHGQGILHRDVKPDNALVASDGSVKLFDFGLARIADQGFGDQSLLLGTPFYMAPEQLTGGKVDHRADVYALGVLLYRMLAGELPFRDGNIFAAHVLEPVPDPRRYNPHLPEPAVQLLMRMLAKAADQRPASCRPIAVDLWSALFGGG
ncbi:MAG: protein kinase [Deltaproteobacteria bacterium]|nr:protein kinase [Deltaproteobacteria bacterium]